MWKQIIKYQCNLLDSLRFSSFEDSRFFGLDGPQLTIVNNYSADLNFFRVVEQYMLACVVECYKLKRIAKRSISVPKIKFLEYRWRKKIKGLKKA